MEIPSNTWGPLLHLQEIKEIFCESKNEECQNVQGNDWKNQTDIKKAVSFNF